MGIENRDYLKGDNGFGGPMEAMSRRKPATIVGKLIVVTAAVFVLQLLTSRGQGDSLVQQWLSLDAGSVFRQGQLWRLLTYAFCHSQSDLLHIVFNMYIVYAIAPLVCQLTGEREFLWYYLASAIFAGITSVAFYTAVQLPFHIIGASGAVMAVFMLFAMHYPRREVFLFGVIAVQVRWLLAVYIAMDALPVIRMVLGDAQAIVDRANAENRPLVAHSAHLGGLLFGFLYFRWHMRLTDWWDRVAGRLPSRKPKKPDIKVFNPQVQPESDMTERVDEILQKISREGETSLTSRERNILTQASRQLRKDRNR